MEDHQLSISSLQEYVDSQEKIISSMQVNATKDNRAKAKYCIDLDLLREQAKEATLAGDVLRKKLDAALVKLEAAESPRSLNISATSFVPGAPVSEGPLYAVEPPPIT